jgi:hypothetical protein
MPQAETYSICFRLRRITIEDAFVRVPVTTEVFKASPEEDGTLRLDTERLVKAAMNLGDDAKTEWVAEGPATVELHPIQGPPPDGR